MAIVTMRELLEAGIHFGRSPIDRREALVVVVQQETQSVELGHQRGKLPSRHRNSRQAQRSLQAAHRVPAGSSTPDH